MSEDIGARITKFEKNDSSLTKLEVLSGEGINNSMIERIAAALPSNTHCLELLLKGCNVSTENAKTLATGLAGNSTLKKIDFESNRIDPSGIIAIAQALRDNQSLTEVRLQNQKGQFGNEAETAIADMMEVNTYIEKIPLTLKSGGARVRVNKYETRNREFNRRRKKGETIAPVTPVSGTPVASTSSSAAPSTSTSTPSASASTSSSTSASAAKAEADAAAKKKAEEDAKKKADADAAAAKKKAEEDAKKKAEADAAAKKKAEADAAKAAASKPVAPAAAPTSSASASAGVDEKAAAEMLQSKFGTILSRIEATLTKLGV